MIFLTILLTFISGAICVDQLKITEGDIVVDKEIQDIIDGNISPGYDGMKSRLWPGGVIPYVFDGRFDSYRRRAVYEAIKEYNKYTCIRFVPRSSQRNYVRFMVGGGCYSSIGMTGRGYQDISIGNGCHHKGIVIHEMMHAAGFFHEQSRRDRDNYITIYWQNIIRGMEYNFKKYSHGQADTFGEPYDFDSVMHYGKYAFSSNRRPTILARGNTNRQLGQRRGFSQIDIKQLNKMYNCKGGPKPVTYPPTAPPAGCRDKNSNCQAWARSNYCNNPRYKDYMQRNCCKACKGTSSTCFDSNTNCPAWTKSGYCKSNPRYMNVYCKKSCKVC